LEGTARLHPNRFDIRKRSWNSERRKVVDEEKELNFEWKVLTKTEIKEENARDFVEEVSINLMSPMGNYKICDISPPGNNIVQEIEQITLTNSEIQDDKNDEVKIETRKNTKRKLNKNQKHRLVKSY
jgi:hypothetical protein